MREGQLLNGRYRLTSRLGTGGMGEVWKADDTHTPPRVVAVKGVCRDPESVPGSRERLAREAAILGGLSHPHIVPITDRFFERNQLHLVMQYVPGQNLQEALDSSALSDAAKASVLIDVLDALSYLHDETPVVHRDLKPSNILLDKRQRAYVTDFGIARSLADPDATKAAYIIGTPNYIAPEVRDGAPATAASDVWSFGAVALLLFAGRKFSEGLPTGSFAGEYTYAIRAALRIQASQRPSASQLLKSFRSAQLRGAAPIPPTPVTGTRLHSGSAEAAAATGTRRPAWLLIIIGLAVLFAGGALAANAMQQKPPAVVAPPASSAAPSPTPTQTETPTGTPAPTPTPTIDSPSPTPSDSTSAPYAGRQWVYLASMPYIDAEIVGRPGRCDGGCTGFRLHPTSIAGRMYPQSWEMRMDGDGKKSTTTWNAYTKCTKMEATIGLSDNSQSVQAHFLLQREGGATDDFGVLRTGQSKRITVDLTGTFRFTVVSYLAVPQTLDTTSAGVWGDARMLCTDLPTQGP